MYVGFTLTYLEGSLARVLRSFSWKSSQWRVDGQLAAAEVDEGDEWGGAVEAEGASSLREPACH
jgi:hypothetical protein